MGNVHAIVFGYHFGQFNDFFGLCMSAGYVDQGGRHAHGTFLHSLPEQLFHLVHFLWAGGAVFIAHNKFTQCTIPYKRSDVGRHPLVFQIIQILAQGSPFDIVFDGLLIFLHIRFHSGIQWPHGAAFPKDFQGNPLPDVALRTPVFDKAHIGPTEHVYKAGGNRHPFGIDFLFASGVCQVADRCNAIAANPYIPDVGGIPGSVIQLTVSDEYIKGFRRAAMDK